ncbi:uncharacterized protein LOC135479078 [Liolophura sinensis]|uniref:uncharacterized protein LOC135479078 n=1 Tax=Liolophura sinensis TaxID=3198878 RepID=UPI003159521E
MEPDMRKVYNGLWLTLTIVTVLVTRHTFAVVDSLGCVSYNTSLLPFIALNVTLLTTHKVAASVILSAGYYDGINVYIYDGGNELSSGSVNLSRHTFGPGILLVNLTNPLTVGETHDVTARTRTGSVCSYSAKSVQATVIEQQGSVVVTTPAPLQTTTPVYVPSTPTLASAVEESGGIRVTWTTDTGQLYNIIVTAQPSSGAPVTKEVSVFGNQPQSTTIPTDRLVKGQTYTLWLIAESRGVQSSRSSPLTVTLTPSRPVLLSITPSSGDQTIAVRWRNGGGIVDRFYVRIHDTLGWSKEDEVPYRNTTDKYCHVFKAPMPGVYNMLVKSHSGQLNSSYVEFPSVTLNPSPVNISVQSKTSRSIQLNWQRTDNNIRSYKMVVSWGGSCVQTVYFADELLFPNPTSPCVSVRTEVFDVNNADITYNITGLLPYTEYQLALYVTFLSGNEPSRLNVMTEVGVPAEVYDIRVTVKETKNVSVCWKPPEPFPGPTSYTLTLVDLGEELQQDREQVIAGK